ncbi:unnamed protein product [Rhizophagus irregularis]|nr:unnamed protein product [Rhizophagus irregularis]
MIQSIKEIYVNTKHLLCIFHIDLNLQKKFKGKLRNKVFGNTVPWIHKRFTTGAQSTQRIELINRHIHDKVDQATSLYDLLLNIKDHVRNEEHFKYFELERNAIPTICMPMLNTRFFGSVDNVIKVEIDNEEISNGISTRQMTKNRQKKMHFDLCREQEQDIQQILFKSLIKNIPLEAILELDNLSPISVCGTQTEDRVGMEKSITFQHFFSFRIDSHVSNLAIKSTKAIYVELFGLSKKVIDCALKANMQHELMNLLKSFIYDTYNKNVEIQETQETFTDINNSTITKHKGQPSKRFKSSVETKVAEETRRILERFRQTTLVETLGKLVLKDSTKINMITDNVIVEEETNNTKG